MGLDFRHAATLDDFVATDPMKPLINELSAAPEELRRFLEAAIEEAEVEDYPEPSIGDLIREAVESAGADLINEEISKGLEHSGGLDFSDVPIPGEIETPTIAHVEPDPESVEWDAYETYEEETLLVRATIDADVEIQGLAFKADYLGLEDEVSLIEFDWSKHHAFVATSIQARLVFQLRVESGARIVEGIEFEMAEGVVLPADQ